MPPGAALHALVASGDNRSARRRARAILQDAGAADDEREAARATLRGLGFDRAALAAGLGVLALQITWVVVLFMA